MQNSINDRCVIAVDPRANSFGFVVIDKSGRLLHWGAKSFRRGVNAVKIPAPQKIAALLEDFSPKLVALKSWTDNPGKRRLRMHQVISNQARMRGIPVYPISRATLKSTFAQ